MLGATYVTLEDRLTLVTAPTAEPITVAEARYQIRQEDSADDGTLETLLIPAARERCENETLRQMVEATYELKLDRFPATRELELPRPPLRSVTSITYRDSNGDTQTFATANYRVSTPVGARCQRGAIGLATGATWPVTIDEIEAVTIRFVAGYRTAVAADAALVPARLKMAMLADLATLYVHREDLIVGRLVSMLHRVKRVYGAYKSWPQYR